MSILGFDFVLGPEVPPPACPESGRPAKGWAREQWRSDWRHAIDQAIQDEDAWGLLCTAPDCDVTLRDVLTPGAVWAATAAFTVHLLLARESVRPTG